MLTPSATTTSITTHTNTISTKSTLPTTSVVRPLLTATTSTQSSNIDGPTSIDQFGSSSTAPASSSTCSSNPGKRLVLIDQLYVFNDA